MRKILPVLGASLLSTLSSSSLFAQETAPEPEKEILALEEVIVTATRRVQNIQDVAMSVSAFTGDFLAETGVTDLQGLEQYTPNLKITPVGGSSRDTSFRIRGIGSVGSNSGIDPSVGIFLDGIYQGRAGMSINDLVDVERVEVLRGPQGTLYGKNTAAGAISVITRKPSLEFESMVELNYDSNELMELRGMVNLPLGDSGHAARLSGWYVDGDHLFENTFRDEGVNDQHKWGARGRFLFDLGSGGAGDGLGELVLTVDYTKEDTDCCALTIMDYEGLSVLNSPATETPSQAWQQELGMNDAGKYIVRYRSFEEGEGYSPPPADPFGDDYWFDDEIYNKVDVGGVALEWNNDLANDTTVTFLNAWRFYESDVAFDGDFTAYSSNKSEQTVDLDQFSSELRFTSPGGETFDYQAGLYAYYSELDSVGTFTQHVDLVEKILVFPELDVYMDAVFPNGTVNVDDNSYTTTSYAAFGQVVWNITDEFSATLGLRYTYEKKEREGTQRSDPPFFADIPPIAGPDYDYDDKRSDSDVSPALNLRYFINPDVMVYGLVSRGFKSGGYDQRRQVADENGEFDEEIATNYELGWKTSWMNRRLQFNGTLFYVDYEDFQSQAVDGAGIRVTNAGSLESYGTELELIFIPMADMTLGTAIGYNKAEYDSFDGGQCTVEQLFYQHYVTDGVENGAAPGMWTQCTQDLAGETLHNAPEYTISSFLQYDKSIGEDLEGSVRLEHSHIDEYYLDQDLDPNLVNDAVDLVNLRLTLSNSSRSWEAILWGSNMLDEEYYTFGLDTPTLGGYSGVAAPEATYGVTLRWYQ